MECDASSGTQIIGRDVKASAGMRVVLSNAGRQYIKIFDAKHGLVSPIRIEIKWLAFLVRMYMLCIAGWMARRGQRGCFLLRHKRVRTNRIYSFLATTKSSSRNLFPSELEQNQHPKSCLFVRRNKSASRVFPPWRQQDHHQECSFLTRFKKNRVKGAVSVFTATQSSSRGLLPFTLQWKQAYG